MRFAHNKCCHPERSLADFAAKRSRRTCGSGFSTFPTNPGNTTLRPWTFSSESPWPPSEPLHLDPHHHRLAVEAQAAIRLVPVPKSNRFPYSVFIAALFGGEHLAVDPRKFARQMEHHARIHARHQKLIRPQLRHQRGSMRILRARRAPSIGLRKTERHRCLPPAEINFPGCLSRLLHRGLHLALELQLRDFAFHWLNQRK